jgi:hypothetical protein
MSNSKGSEALVMVTAKLTPGEDKALKQIARSNHRTRAGQVRHVLLQHIEREAA